ncbi:MAG: hypothetical protein QX203_07195 [Methylococcaceae bacterium]
MCLQIRTFLSLLLVTSAALAFNVSAAAIVPLSVNAGYINTENSTSPLGSNLAPVADYTGEYPFINYFRMARLWFSAPSDFSAFSDDQPLALDSNRNVTSLTAKQFARTILFTNLPDPGLSGKKLHLYYDGDGELFYGNVKIISQSPGHDVIQLNKVTSPDSNLAVQITLASTNTNNPLRNIRLLPSGGICAGNPRVTVAASGNCPNNDFKSFEKFHEGILFNPQFLDTIKSYRSIRFMDWMRTNNSTQVNFSQRPLPSHQFWSTEKGVPLEVMVALTNLMDIEPWFNIPHKATDDYVRKFAGLIKAQLEPDRRAYIEYSNEVWNGLFTQTAYATDNGVRLGLNILENGQIDDATGMVRFYSKRSQRIFDIFKAVLGDTSRIRRVMSTQAVVPYFTEEILKFGQAAQKTDVFAIAPYFGDTIVDTGKRNELIRLGVDGVFDWLLKDNNTLLDFGSLPSIDRIVQAQVDVLKPHGIPLTSYEGGQHFLASGVIFRDQALDDLMDAVNRDPRMKQVYLTYLDNWLNRTGEVFHHYVNSDWWSIFGRWGAKEYPSQKREESPKFDALMTYVENNPLP